MESVQVPRPAWMTEDLVLLEEQAKRFLASELVPHVEKWSEDGIMEQWHYDPAADLDQQVRRAQRRVVSAEPRVFANGGLIPADRLVVPQRLLRQLTAHPFRTTRGRVDARPAIAEARGLRAAVGPEV